MKNILPFTYTPCCLDKCLLARYQHVLKQHLTKIQLFRSICFKDNVLPSSPSSAGAAPCGSQSIRSIYMTFERERLMHPITSHHSLFRSCSPAVKWIIQLESGYEERFCRVSGNRVFYCSPGASCLSH